MHTSLGKGKITVSPTSKFFKTLDAIVNVDLKHMNIPLKAVRNNYILDYLDNSDDLQWQQS